MNGYFFTMIIMHALLLGINLAKHGEEEIKIEKYNFFTQLFGSTIDLAIIYMAIKTGF